MVILTSGYFTIYVKFDIFKPPLRLNVEWRQFSGLGSLYS